MLLSRATGAGECEISIVKAILVLVFWKDPTDKSAWIKIGTAIRLGYQLGLHLTGRSGGDDQDLKDARRTWYCEFHMDPLIPGLSCQWSDPPHTVC